MDDQLFKDGNPQDTWREACGVDTSNGSSEEQVVRYGGKESREQSFPQHSAHFCGRQAQELGTTRDTLFDNCHTDRSINAVVSPSPRRIKTSSQEAWFGVSTNEFCCYCRKIYLMRSKLDRFPLAVTSVDCIGVSGLAELVCISLRTKTVAQLTSLLDAMKLMLSSSESLLLMATVLIEPLSRCQPPAKTLRSEDNLISVDLMSKRDVQYLIRFSSHLRQRCVAVIS